MRRITTDSPYPFFGLAEILAMGGDESSEKYEHRSVVAMDNCDLARISRDDFEAMISKFPSVHTDLKAIALVRNLLIFIAASRRCCSNGWPC